MLTLSSGIPFGLVIIIGGAALLHTSPYKTLAKLILGMGAFVVIAASLLVLLAVFSQM